MIRTAWNWPFIAALMLTAAFWTAAYVAGLLLPAALVAPALALAVISSRQN